MGWGWGFDIASIVVCRFPADLVLMGCIICGCWLWAAIIVTQILVGLVLLGLLRLDC